MNNTNLASRIKDLRNRKGYSQDLLAENSELSLRTIQRIEKGESTPRGDTLVRLSQALGVTPDDLLEWKEVEDKGYLTLMNFSALTSIVYSPLLGIIIPLVMWIYKRDKVKHVDDYGKKLINFQITFTLILYTLYIIINHRLYIELLSFIEIMIRSIQAIFYKANIFSSAQLALLLFWLTVNVYLIILIFKNYARIQKGQEAWFRPAIPFLR